MPSSPKKPRSLFWNKDLVPKRAAPKRTFLIFDPVIEMQVVEGCPFVPFPTLPTSRKPARTSACHCALVQLVASSTVLICMFSRMMSEVGCAAPWSVTVNSACLLLFVPNKLCTLTPLNAHLLVERM